MQGSGPALVIERALADAAGETALPFSVVAVQDRSGLDQRGRRDHEAVRLDEAEPFEVGAGVRVGGGHSSIGQVTATEILCLEQCPMFLSKFLTLMRCVNHPPWFRNNLHISKVIFQLAIVGI